MILRKSKIDHYKCPSASLFLEGDRDCILENYVLSGTLIKREGSRLLGFSLRLAVSLQFLSFSDMRDSTD